MELLENLKLNLWLPFVALAIFLTGHASIEAESDSYHQLSLLRVHVCLALGSTISLYIPYM